MTRWPFLFLPLLGAFMGLAQWSSPLLRVTPFITISLLLISTPVSHPSWFQRFKTGWLFTLGYFCASLYWVPNSLYVHYDTFYWAIPFAFLGIPAICALCFGISTLLIPWQSCKGVWRVLLFSSAWMLGEALLNLPFGGFPWALLGYIWHTPLEIAQIAYYVSVYGLSFLTLLFGAFLYLWFFYKQPIYRLLLGIFMLLLAVFLLLLGHFRLKTPQNQLDLPSIRLVQPNIPQEKKWHPIHQTQNFQKISALSYGPGYETKEFIIWPEATLTYNVTSRVLAHITRPLKSNQYLIIGTITGLSPQKDYKNTLLVLDHRGTVVAQYHKHHLVPFGEYIPFHQVLEKISPVPLTVLSHIKTNPGKRPETLKVASHPPFSPQICFESLFHSLISKSPTKPKWILNLTNDAWFGNSEGPQQHLRINQFRAIQSNLPVVRAASTGISAIIDARGRLIKTLEYNKTGVIDYGTKKDQIRRSGQV